MSRPCSCCVSPARNSIDEAILNGEPESSIAARFNVSRSSVNRHKAHPPTSIVKAESIREVQEAVTIADKLASLEKETREILAEARGAIGKDNRLALQALARLERQYEIRARIEGELPGPTISVQIINSPEWLRIRSAFLRVLQPYPAIRSQLVLELSKITGESGGNDGND